MQSPSETAAMIPGLVLFKARQISWNKEQKQGFFQQKKNKYITIHRKLVQIFTFFLKLLEKETMSSRFCSFLED